MDSNEEMDHEDKLVDEDQSDHSEDSIDGWLKTSLFLLISSHKN